MLQLRCMVDEQWVPWEQREGRRIKRGKPGLWIGLPLFIGLLIVAGLIAAVYATGFGTTRIWADVSLVLILLPLCVLGILPLALLVALSFGVAQLVDWLPDPLRQLDDFLARVAREARKGSKLAARPLLGLHGVMATISAFLRGLLNLFR